MQTQEFDRALEEAISCGDPNNINKVFSEVFQAKGLDELIKLAASKYDGLRHLRNYAKAWSRLGSRAHLAR